MFEEKIYSQELFELVKNHTENKEKTYNFKLTHMKKIGSYNFIKIFDMVINKNDEDLLLHFLKSGKINFSLYKLKYGGMLYQACGNYCIKIIKHLIETGKSDPGFYDKNDENAYTALMLMCDYGKEDDEIIDIINLILLTGESNHKFTNKKGKSAISLARENKCFKIEKLILEYN